VLIIPERRSSRTSTQNVDVHAAATRTERHDWAAVSASLEEA
jgi:hypothetical protein